MACLRCHSDNAGTFSVEMNFHFPGWEGMEKPTVLVFPEVVVCLDCGFAEFAFPEAELPLLKDRAA